jgi:hypothetical protein
MEELRQQTRDVLDGKEAQPVIFPYQVGVGEGLGVCRMVVCP